MAVSEYDWKLFRARLPVWQETYMEKLKQEYIALLAGPGSAADKLRELDKRRREDSERGGTVMRMSRSNMELNILHLLSNGVITLADLDGFSENLREKMAFLLRESDG